MRTDLTKVAIDRKREVDVVKREVGAMLKGFAVELKGIRFELAGGRDEWQKLATNLRFWRSSAAVAAKPAIAGIAEEAAEITPESAVLRDQVFGYLANHPDGTRMTELEQEFGLARIQLAKVVRSLIDENKVEKRELYYFAV